MVTASQTRVCIKNLPPSASEQDLKEFLVESSKQRLEITDCRILKNGKGKSRKVAFVGFRQPDQANYVVDNFHKTFMGMSRLSVEHAMAKKQNDDVVPTAQSGTGTGTQRKDAERKKAKPTSDEEFNLKTNKIKQPKLHGELPGLGQKSKFWANDEGIPEIQEAPVPGHHDAMERNTRDDDEDAGTSTSSDSDDDDNDDDEREVKDESETGNAQTSSKALSDLDFLRSKQKAIDDLEVEDMETQTEEGVKLTEAGAHTDILETRGDGSSQSGTSSSDDSSSDQENDDHDDHEEKKHSQSASRLQDGNFEDDIEQEVENSRKESTSKSRLFVRNLPFDTTEEELEEYFSTFGKLVECHIPVDDKKQNKGFAFVQYESAVDALEAQKQLDKMDFQGRLLHILPAKPAPSASESDRDGSSTWKQKKEQLRKEQDIKSGSDGGKGWSASFVRTDAVVDNLAERLGLRKADFLGVKDKLSSGDAAVRLALAETQIIEENRQYFLQNGIDMEALVSSNTDDKSVKRSKTSMLVKNLPYDTRVEELNKIFQLGDEPVTILLPPSRTIALVEYGHHSDAKKAFRRLAYRRFKHVPLYLEWAPLAAKLEGEKAGTECPTVPTSSNKERPERVGDIEEDILDGTITTMYVKNLSFSTTEETLRQVFEKHVGSVRSVRIPKKVAPSKITGEEPQMLSMGYGFVELESESSVKKALQVLQGKLVEGHAWEVTVSSKNDKNKKTNQSSSGKNPTKLVVRNVPFQATRQELLKLFGSFGQLRKVRLPKKFDGTHRGFAFVEFLTSKEAVNAMNALSRTHLYGRHLVLEWASDDDQDIERLREKAKRTVDDVAVPMNKKIKFT